MKRNGFEDELSLRPARRPAEPPPRVTVDNQVYYKPGGEIPPIRRRPDFEEEHFHALDSPPVRTVTDGSNIGDNSQRQQASPTYGRGKPHRRKVLDESWDGVGGQLGADGSGGGHFDRPPTPLGSPDHLTEGSSRELRSSVKRMLDARCDPQQHMDLDVDDVWWQDAVIMGRLAALGVQFYARNMTCKCMKVWKRYMRYRYRKKRIAHLRHKQLQFRLLRMRVLQNSPTYRPYIDALKTISSWIHGNIGQAFQQLHKNVFQYRDMRRRVALFTIVRSRVMERIAQTHFGYSLTRLGFLGFRIWARWVKEVPEVQDKKYEVAKKEPSPYSAFISQVATRTLLRWKRNIDFHKSTEEYISKYTEQWLLSVPGVRAPRQRKDTRLSDEVVPSYTPWHLGSVSSPKRWRQPFPETDFPKEVPELEFSRRMQGSTSSSIRHFCTRDRISVGPFLTNDMRCGLQGVAETQPLAIPPQRTVPDATNYVAWGQPQAAKKASRNSKSERISRVDDPDSDDDIKFCGPDPGELQQRAEPGVQRYTPAQKPPGSATYQSLRNRINPVFLGHGFQMGSRPADEK